MKKSSRYMRVFDRPAFYTPIHQESNLGDFKQAITDTIQALGTRCRRRWIYLLNHVTRATSLAHLRQVVLLGELLQVHLDRVAVCTR